MKSITWRGMMLLLVLLLGSGVVHGQLAWDKTEQTVEASWELDRLQATFSFANGGSYPLLIKWVKPLNDGLQVNLTGGGGGRGTIRPGQTGKVQLSLANVGVFSEQHYLAEVATDEMSQHGQTLLLKVVPPGWEKLSDEQKQKLKAEGERLSALAVPIRMTPDRLFWRGIEGGAEGGEGGGKTVKVEVLSATPIRVTGVKFLGGSRSDLRKSLGSDASGESPFEVTVQEIQPGREYQLTVTPKALVDSAKDGERGGMKEGVRGGMIAARWELQADLDGDQFKRQKMAGGLFLTAMRITGEPRGMGGMGGQGGMGGMVAPGSGSSQPSN